MRFRLKDFPRRGYALDFDPSTVLANPPERLKRPYFLAIVSSYVLALTMATRATGKVDGIVVEGHFAGGHNAPPRGVLSRRKRRTNLRPQRYRGLRENGRSQPAVLDRRCLRYAGVT